jgi:peptide deformylase
MSVHQIIKMGHPTLRLKAKAFTKKEIITKETKKLIKDMFQTMTKVGGIGLAAPQINVSKQLAIIELPSESKRYPEAPASETYILFNPKVKILDKKFQGFWEGCLSVPGLRGYVERPRKIEVSYLDEKARPQKIIVEDFLATVFQHELDHLFGVLYVDKIKSTKLFAYEDEVDHLLSSKKGKLLD